MPPKDLKSAKKIYSKLKKERKVLQETSASNEGAGEAVSEEVHSNTSKDNNKKEGTDNSDTSSEALKNDKQEPTTTSEISKEKDTESHSDSQQVVSQPSTTEAPAHADNTGAESTKEVKNDKGEEEKVVEETATKENASEKAAEKTDKSNAPKEANKLEEKEITTSPTDSNNINASKSKQNDVAEESEASVIADLRNENETLKEQIKMLERKITQLESEISSLKVSDSELSLSPLLEDPDGNFHSEHPHHHHRTASFVEADLYSDVDKVSSREKQMDRWIGYQLDMREWTSSQGIGRIVTF